MQEGGKVKVMLGGSEGERVCFMALHTAVRYT